MNAPRVAALALAFAVACCTAGTPGPAAASVAPGPLLALQSSIDALSGAAPGHVALEIEDLATGETSGINERSSMPAASTIKIPVMIEVFRQMASGKVAFADRVRLENRDRDYGSGDLCDARAGSSYTVETLLRKMIDESDNTATNMLIRLVGLREINTTLRDLDMHQTVLRGDVRTTTESVRTGLRTSPSDMVRLLARIARGDLIDPWSSRQMLAILAHQEINTLLPRALPSDVTIAHKTGSLHDTLNDVGIVYHNGEPYVIAVMTTHLPNLPAGRSFIRRVSRLAFDAIERVASWRAEQGLPGFRMGAAEPSTVDDGAAPVVAGIDDAVAEPTPPPALDQIDVPAAY